MTSENKKAVINVSQSVPIVTGQQTGTTVTGTTHHDRDATPRPRRAIGSLNQTVEYRDAGVILTVTPRIGERGTVALDVKQEVNAVGPPVPPTNSPSFNKREAETSVVLLNNQTLVLGGLIQDKVTDSPTAGIPFLKNIPLIGYLFGFKERAIEQTELLLLITPKVIGTALDAARDHRRDAARDTRSSTTRSTRRRSGHAPACRRRSCRCRAPCLRRPAAGRTEQRRAAVGADDQRPLAPPPPPPPAMPPPPPTAEPAPVPQAVPPPAPQVVPAPPPQ